ncbi:MAG TPA: hypothetical protein PLJ74_05315 [Myxococcota bacterium]|nr:hypothetical protein [Myxococcota bacterium]
MSISEKEIKLRREWLEEYLATRKLHSSCYAFSYTLPASWDVFAEIRMRANKPIDFRILRLPFECFPFDILESIDDAPEIYHDVEIDYEIRDLGAHNSYMINHPETAKNLGPFWKNLNLKEVIDEGYLMDTYGITLRQAQILAEVDLL